MDKMKPYKFEVPKPIPLGKGVKIQDFFVTSKDNGTISLDGVRKITEELRKIFMNKIKSGFSISINALTILGDRSLASFVPYNYEVGQYITTYKDNKGDDDDSDDEEDKLFEEFEEYLTSKLKNIDKFTEAYSLTISFKYGSSKENAEKLKLKNKKMVDKIKAKTIKKTKTKSKKKPKKKTKTKSKKKPKKKK